jgi:hypothetical protein
VASIGTQTDVRRALLGGLIDHAPLFPPASLPLAEALEDHRRALASPESWMVSRFVCPASRLGEIEGEPLRLSVVVDVPPEELDERVEAVEGRGDPSELARLAPEAYVELPLDGRLEEGIAGVQAAGARAKVRCGPDVPSSEALAVFVRSCRAAGVVFKATAGLHHAVRTGGQHGFLNLLAAAVFGDEERALDEDEPDAFTLGPAAFAWRRREAAAGEVSRVRRTLFASIGSCSFTEPVDELKAFS